MATINKIYPHVNVTTRALTRTVASDLDTGATTLFVPFFSRKGPNNVTKRIFNLNQFVSEYGEPDFDYQGRTGLILYNWLNAGGAVHGVRITPFDATRAEGRFDLAEEGDQWVDVAAEKLYEFTSGTWSEVNSQPAFGQLADRNDTGFFFNIATSKLYADGVADPTPNEDLGVPIQTYQPLGFTVTAKYPGSFYNDIRLDIRKSNYSTENVTYLDVDILLEGRRVQSLFRLTSERFVSVLSSTEFIDIAIDAKSNLGEDFDSLEDSDPIQLSGGSNGSLSFEETLARFFGADRKVITTDSIDSSNLTGILTLSFTDSVVRNWLVGESVKLTYSNDTVIGEITAVSGLDITIDVGTLQIGSTGPNIWNVSIIREDIEDIDWDAQALIANKLDNPIDLILDAGYPEIVTDLIKEFSLIRDDVMFYFSTFDFTGDEMGEEKTVDATEINHAVYTQKFSVNDIVSGKNILVPATYFLASLIPFNDLTYGIQWPVAGLTRGVLTGVEGFNENPTSDRKTAYYTQRINYVERDSRGYKFMSQLTGEQENTALRFINNVRVVNRMVRDLENLGREYLFEFNDATTLNNMRNALNNYVSGWIQNRTLSLGNVEVTPDEFSDERVNVNLNIRFTGTIEIISIDITIE